MRPTQDLDFFTSPGAGSVRRARDDFVAAGESRGWTVEHLRDTDTFCRLLIRGPEDLLVDLALDSPPGRPATASIAGPTFALDELAGRKVIALFDRAAARDFVDVFALTRTFTTDVLLARAAEVDLGFDVAILADMVGNLTRYADRDLALGEVDVPALRAFFQAWAAELRARS